MRTRFVSLLALGIAICHTPAATAADTPAIRGVNIAGAEFAPQKLPGEHGKDYLYPAPAIITAFADFGMNTIRVPFLWERIQPKLGGPLDVEELKRLDAVVAEAEKHQLTVILDLHNYGLYHNEMVGSKTVPTQSLAQVWQLLAQHYKKQDHVMFGIMNEPNKHDAAEWARIAKSTLQAIRSTGAKQTVLVPGTLFTGAHSWNKKAGKRSNAEALAKLRDTNMLIEFHHYFDYNYSGTHPECTPPEMTEAALAEATTWLKKTRHKGILAEFGAAKSEPCLKALSTALDTLNKTPKEWRGWTYWGASEWFGDYPFNIYPVKPETYPQLTVLKAHIN